MAMTTTIEKILQKAEALEAQAAALRLAVTILNGDLTAAKRGTVARTISQAMKIRHAQKNGGAPAAEAVGGGRVEPCEDVHVHAGRRGVQVY